MIHLLDKLTEKFTDLRGNIEQGSKIGIDYLRQQIIENTKLKEFQDSSAGQTLIKSVKDYLVALDSRIDGEKGDKIELFKEKRAWLSVLEVLLGGKNRLKAIEAQIDYYLNKED